MGKGFNNYMTKKFFHPASKDNIKRKWMAEQKTAFEKKSQEELLAQYQKEQEVLSNRALLGDEKAKLGLSFLYDAPPGLKKKEECEGQQQEVKFEWQRKYNAPRENYAKDDDTIRDQPFGIEVRNVRCIKCRQWGHVNTDKICPLFGKNLTAEPEMPEMSNTSLLDGLKEDGFTIKNSVLGRIMESQPDRQHSILQEDEDDPEVKFLKSLTPKQKKKLLKKLNKMQSTSGKGIGKKSKKRKSSGESEDPDSSGEESRHSRSHKKKLKVEKHHKSQHKYRHSRPDSSDSESEHKVKRKDERKVCKRDRSMSSDEDSRHASDRQRRQGHRDEQDRKERNEHRGRERSRSKERRRRRSRSNDREQRYEKYDHGKRRDKS